jgi:DNA-binding response OmpR family regulator
MEKAMILVIEDEHNIRQRFVEFLKSPQRVISQAENMERARNIFRDDWNKIDLIIMDVMLPKNDVDSIELKKLMMEREEAYDQWLILEEIRESNDNQQWRRARFAVDLLDRKIFELLDDEGGINLIKERVALNGGDKLQKPVIYLSARENRPLQEVGLDLIMEGRSEWLVKPVTEEEVKEAVHRLLSNKES